MSDYRPDLNHMVPFMFLKPVHTMVNGMDQKSYPDKGPIIYASYKTYGGSEREVNGINVIEDTGVMETWYRPDLTSDCLLIRLGDKAKFEIQNEPENISMMNKYLKFRVRRLKGGI